MQQKRRFPRVILNTYAFLLDASTKSQILIYDFSSMGIGFVCTKEVSLKTFISIVYQNENGIYIRMKSFVKHCRLIKGNSFFVGVQFIAIESKSDRVA